MQSRHYQEYRPIIGCHPGFFLCLILIILWPHPNYIQSFDEREQRNIAMEKKEELYSQLMIKFKCTRNSKGLDFIWFYLQNNWIEKYRVWNKIKQNKIAKKLYSYLVRKRELLKNKTRLCSILAYRLSDRPQGSNLSPRTILECIVM